MLTRSIAIGALGGAMLVMGMHGTSLETPINESSSAERSPTSTTSPSFDAIVAAAYSAPVFADTLMPGRDLVHMLRDGETSAFRSSGLGD